MTIELEIEKAIADYLRYSVPGIEINTINEDIELLIQLAQAQPNGLVVVSHSNQSADYSLNPASFPNYEITERYVITILSNNRRDKEGLYEYMSLFRNLMVHFVWRNRRMRQVSHSISPQKFPDMKDGVFIGDLEFEIKIRYPNDNNQI